MLFQIKRNPTFNQLMITFLNYAKTEFYSTPRFPKPLHI